MRHRARLPFRQLPRAAIRACTAHGDPCANTSTTARVGLVGCAVKPAGPGMQSTSRLHQPIPSLEMRCASFAPESTSNEPHPSQALVHHQCFHRYAEAPTGPADFVGRSQKEGMCGRRALARTGQQWLLHADRAPRNTSRTASSSYKSLLCKGQESLANVVSRLIYATRWNALQSTLMHRMIALRIVGGANACAPVRSRSTDPFSW